MTILIQNGFVMVAICLCFIAFTTTSVSIVKQHTKGILISTLIMSALTCTSCISSYLIDTGLAEHHAVEVFVLMTLCFRLIACMILIIEMGRFMDLPITYRSPQIYIPALIGSIVLVWAMFTGDICYVSGIEVTWSKQIYVPMAAGAYYCGMILYYIYKTFSMTDRSRAIKNANAYWGILILLVSGSVVEYITRSSSRVDQFIMVVFSFLYVYEHSVYNSRDKLTGCFLRRYFYANIDDRDEHTMFYADMNGLKKINDNEGHAAGDKAIATVGKIMLDTFSQLGGRVYRIGGDEFCIICTSLSEHLVRSMISDIQEMAKLRKISCAMGYSMTSVDMDIYDVYKKADQMMYDDKSKMKGSNHGKTENSDS